MQTENLSWGFPLFPLQLNPRKIIPVGDLVTYHLQDTTKLSILDVVD